MAAFDDTQLTQAVLKSFAGAPDPRTALLLRHLITHVHQLVRETELTFDEWRAAIDFLTRTGQTCSAFRQEYILLSDVLGVSMLVDAINHKHHPGATDTTVLGPFYVGEHRVVPHGTDLAPGAPGEKLWVEGQVTDATGKPLAEAAIDVWHADGDGHYDSQQPDYRPDQPRMRARFISGADGRFYFRTIVPHSYPVPTDGPVGELLAAARRHAMRPAHIHFLLDAPGFDTLVTHVFAAGNEHLGSDAVFGVKPSLIATLTHHDAPTWPDGTPAPARWQKLAYRFAMKPSNKETAR
jgi:hydroxyquinol 1,2-dioxygenase